MKIIINKIILVFNIFILLICPINTASASSQEKPDAELRSLLKESIEASDSFNDRFDAEVWLLDMSTRLSPKIKNTKERLQLLRHIHYEAKRAKLSPQIVLALIQVESNFDEYAISRVGARGLMQIMPFWLKEIGKTDDNLFNIRTNLRFGCTILRYYLDKEKGNITRALARYNGSLGSYRYTTKVFSALDKRWSIR